MLLEDQDESGRSALSPRGVGPAWVLQEMPLARAGRGLGQLLGGFFTSCLVSTWENPHIAQHRPSLDLPRQAGGDPGGC